MHHSRLLTYSESEHGKWVQSRMVNYSSTSQFLYSMQAKNSFTVLKCYTSIRMAKPKNSDNTKHWWECGAIGTLVHCCWECRMMVQTLWKTVWQFLTKLIILLSYDPAIMFLLKAGWTLRSIQKPAHRCLLIIAKTWKQKVIPEYLDKKLQCASKDGMVIQSQKEMNYQFAKKHRRILNIYY